MFTADSAHTREEHSESERERERERESTRRDFHSHTVLHVSTYCTLSSWRKDLITHLEGIQRYLLQFAEMAEEEGAPQPPPAESLCLASVTQPYPRSPKTLRKPDAAPLEYSQEQLSCWLEELEKESKWTEAHMASLKKRQANLSVRAKRIVLKTSAETMEQQVRERFEAVRLALEKEEQAVLGSLEQEQRENSSRMTRLLNDWNQHLKLVRKHISTVRTLQERGAESRQQVSPGNFSCHKKQDAAELAIGPNDENFQKLMKVLGKISKDLQVRLQKKSLLLDSTVVVIDRTACHRQIKVTLSGRGFYVSPDDSSALIHPLQFDQTCCALGLPAISSGRRYWEVDVHCCSSWAVGVAYGSLHRKGQDKSTKLGRNRLSWSLEFRDGRLSVWHNDRHLTLSARAAPDKVGVFVNYQKGRVAFYDADAVKLLQDFSTSCTGVFERAHHQFTEPVFPAFRFFRARDRQPVPDHMEICDLGL
ncbi:tripartite motif-containing protein 14 isoform X3 [Ictalurus punctatus]|uniref:Tripartite motif-containing protein 14 isoform X3 n=1 Tax=Ictalurus punctatus TaxID=7998 RepID=A0A2D0S8C1_ICTPU|nr:tripartite motif-containing protein 14 isoform X3 [Ictalurus punctatus]